MSVEKEKGGWDFAILLYVPQDPPKAIRGHPGKYQPQGDRDWKCLGCSLGEIIEKLYIIWVNIQDKNCFNILRSV